ncbi:hypothetical protein IFM89_009279 [Coptis chinensis]|uniref:RNase H type-1 domain-containing protein n=1 Tax=Coptis chinensis TaxID=261450 RepID=A0A835I0M9_9MAGN|nr:hypothetical protein IFM89_009279 [Coptis chinensis]
MQATFISKEPILCKWYRPDDDYVKLNTDGSLKSVNQGFGGIARDENGAVLFSYSASNSKKFILHQELLTIEDGLDICLKDGVDKVQVNSDSMVAMHIVNGVINAPWYCQNTTLSIKRKREIIGSSTALRADNSTGAPETLNIQGSWNQKPSRAIGLIFFITYTYMTDRPTLRIALPESTRMPSHFVEADDTSWTFYASA